MGLALLPGAAFAAPAGQPESGEVGFQPSVTPIMDEITSFHNELLFPIIAGIVVLVLVLLIVVILRFNAKAHPVPDKTTHNTLIEVVWTVAPILILVVIAIPSFGILTDQETIPDGIRKYLGGSIYNYGSVDLPAPGLTVKATGNQWFWTYDYPDTKKHFDSNILSDADRAKLKPGEPRLLAVDNDLVVPVNTTVRMQVTGADVIHSFAVPSFGIKIDAVPGRLNETWFNVTKTGIYYGQCSQLCGKDHAFMPIAVRVVTKEQYDAWSKALAAGDVGKANATLPPLEAASS
ncbi:MAG: cytochrome c oxidase subunit II [Devosia sp.]|nr:cytochrome c oxidase subunit II [Devosia sp.]